MLAHHAVLEISNQLTEALARYRAGADATTEIIPYEVAALTIDDVRRIIGLAYQTPGSYSKRCLVIVTRTINREAQHALLKVLEEPPATTEFYIIMPTIAGLVPTVLSRVMMAPVAPTAASAWPTVFSGFMQDTVAKRLETIAGIAKQKADQDYDALYDGLTLYAGTVSEPTVLTAVESALRFLRQKGAAKKMIWEHLALALPVIQKK